MKIRIEQISLEEHILVYSKYIKESETLDEDGADYEYDFDSFISNLDDIQQTILRLYGEEGLIKVIRHFAEGAVGNLNFNAVEYEENSTVFEKIRKLQTKGVASVRSYEKIENVSIPPISKIPADDIYLLNGWLEALPENDDLNVLKMVGSTLSDDSPSLIEVSNRVLRGLNVKVNPDNTKIYSYIVDGVSRYLITTQTSVYLILDQDEGAIIYPGNEFQERQRLLFEKFMTINKVYKLKTSAILETSINNEEYYLLFNVAAGKFESKKRILKK